MISLLFVTNVEAHELTAFQNVLITWVTPTNILLVGCCFVGASALLYLTEKVFKKREVLRMLWEGALYIVGMVCIAYGYFVAGTHNWVFGLVGALVMTGALEVSDICKRSFMSRWRYYLFASIIWSVTAFLYQFEAFGIATAASLFMVFTIYISDRFMGSLKNREKYLEAETRRDKSMVYLFRDTLSALCILLFLVLMQIYSVMYPSLHVFLLGLTLVGGCELVFDLLYVSMKRLHYMNEIGALCCGATLHLDRKRYWCVQLIVLIVALIVWLIGYLTGMRELSLIVYLFVILYLPVKVYDFVDNRVWSNVVTLSGCVVLGVLVYMHRDALGTLTLSDIYSFFRL